MYPVLDRLNYPRNLKESYSCPHKISQSKDPIPFLLTSQRPSFTRYPSSPVSSIFLPISDFPSVFKYFKYLLPLNSKRKQESFLWILCSCLYMSHLSFASRFLKSYLYSSSRFLISFSLTHLIRPCSLSTPLKLLLPSSSKMSLNYILTAPLNN